MRRSEEESGENLSGLKAVKGLAVGVVLGVVRDSEHVGALLGEGRREVRRLELRVTSRRTRGEA